MTTSRTRVTLLDVARGALTMTPDIPHVAKHLPSLLLRRSGRAMSVSYTHLTLPTICSV